VRLQHVLSLDLQTSTAQTEAAIKTLLAYTSGGPDPAGGAGGTWNALVVLAASSIGGVRKTDLAMATPVLRERGARLSF
jgi:hypothetical protein